MIVCSYITLPLYALITQMGSHMKKAVFDEQMAKALKKWRKDIEMKKGKARKLPSKSLGSSESFSISSCSSPTTFHRSKTTGHSSNTKYYKQEEDEDDEMSDLEAAAEDVIDSNSGKRQFHPPLLAACLLLLLTLRFTNLVRKQWSYKCFTITMF